MVRRSPSSLLSRHILVTGLLFCLSSVLVAEDPAPNPGVPELKVLQQFYGTWQGTVGNSEPIIKAKRDWVLDGRFLKHEFSLATGDLSGTIYRGYDQDEQEYVMIFLDSQGHASHLRGHWSPEQKMITFHASDSKMFIQKYESYFPDAKTEKWTISFRSDGNLGDVSGTARRIE